MKNELLKSIILSVKSQNIIPKEEKTDSIHSIIYFLI
jgi:hypothetical protein